MSEPHQDDNAMQAAGEHGHAHGANLDEPKRWLDERKNVDKVFYALVTVCVALVAADFGYHKHAHFDFEEFHAFHALFGFLAYVGLVLTATRLRRFLKRDEDYYE